MNLQDIQLQPEQLAGLTRLLDKMAISSGASRESSDLCRRTYGVQAEVVRKTGSNEETRTVDVIASSAALDSYDEIVEQDWNLDRYKANPVVLYAHNSVGLCGPAEDTLPIGFASDVKVVDGRLHAKLHFVDALANPLAEKVWQGFKQGSLRAVSVGFRPHSVTEEERDGKKIPHLSSNELYEISACPVPANPEAVARSAERNRAQALRLATQTSNPIPESEDMDLKELQASLDAKTAELALAAKATEDAKAEAETLRGQNVKLASERDAALTEAKSASDRADSAEAKVIEAEVEALIGKKIDPAERETMTKLAKSNRELFDEMIAQRADSPLMNPVVGNDPNPAAPSGELVTNDGAELEALIKKSA